MGRHRGELAADWKGRATATEEPYRVELVLQCGASDRAALAVQPSMVREINRRRRSLGPGQQAWLADGS
jgi:hypothetical protein